MTFVQLVIGVFLLLLWVFVLCQGDPGMPGQPGPPGPPGKIYIMPTEMSPTSPSLPFTVSKRRWQRNNILNIVK